MFSRKGAKGARNTLEVRQRFACLTPLRDQNLQLLYLTLHNFT
jgi:hypothetical protein